MATDVVVVERIATPTFTEEEQTIIQFAPIPTGRSYVISATGDVELIRSHLILTLTAFDARDSVAIDFNNGGGRVSFSLVVGVTVPPDEELFTVAKVTGIKWSMGDAILHSVRLVVLPVDSVTVIPFSG